MWKIANKLLDYRIEEILKNLIVTAENLMHTPVEF